MALNRLALFAACLFIGCIDFDALNHNLCLRSDEHRPHWCSDEAADAGDVDDGGHSGSDGGTPGEADGGGGDGGATPPRDAGEVLWVRRWGGPGADLPYAIASHGQLVAVSGAYSASSSIAGVPLVSDGGTDFFVAVVNVSTAQGPQSQPSILRTGGGSTDDWAPAVAFHQAGVGYLLVSHDALGQSPGFDAACQWSDWKGNVQAKVNYSSPDGLAVNALAASPAGDFFGTFSVSSPAVIAFPLSPVSGLAQEREFFWSTQGSAAKLEFPACDGGAGGSVQGMVRGTDVAHDPTNGQPVWVGWYQGTCQPPYSLPTAAQPVTFLRSGNTTEALIDVASDAGVGPLVSVSASGVRWVAVATLHANNGQRLTAQVLRKAPSGLVQRALAPNPGDGGGFELAHDLATDVGGNLIVVGEMSRPIQPKVGAPPLSHHGGTDIFVAKFGPDGSPLWARSFGGPGDERAVGVAVLEAQIVVAARCQQALSFDGISSNALGGEDICLFGLQP